MRRVQRILDRRARGAGFVLAAAVVTLGTGCAFFNTFYNARKAYRSAEETPRAPDGSVNRAAHSAYDEVIEKCEALIANYPDSKWVDDAILLMGKAYYRKSDYDEAIARLDELQADFPESKLIDEAQLFQGKIYVAKDDPARAVPALERVFKRNPKTKYADEILFLLGTSLVRIDREPEALQYLEILAADHPNSTYRLDADLEIASLYLERGDYEKSLTVFRNLAGVKLSTPNRIRFLTRLSEAQVKIGRYKAALRTFRQLEKYDVDDLALASQLVFKAQALSGVDSLPAAIAMFETVTARYKRSIFSAEASYRLGVLYQEKLDSLDVAKARFDQVPRQYSKSPYAEEAIRRSVSITKLQKLKASLDKGEGEDKAGVQFDLAEVQLFQFADHEKALVDYQVILDQYPQSEYAPKAAYAIAYIYDSLLEDEEKARAAYLLVVTRYPDSQQAEFARRYLGLEPVRGVEGPPVPADSLDSAQKSEP
ncbi:MAG: tetratricopeptide repeat protein [Candidatus Krumholzibacteriia bacterium]